MKLKIFTVYHKEYPLPRKNDFHTPIHGGKEINNWILKNIEWDNLWINISRKNPYYCELTVHYYIWKNSLYKKYKYIGFAHYNRRWKINKRLVNNLNLSVDIVVPKKIVISKSYYRSLSIIEHYSLHHNKVDIELVENIINSDYPEYKSFINVLYKKPLFINSMYAWNMFIMKPNLFDEYMTFLFGVLFKLEQKNFSFVKSLYSKYQQRIYWFLGERIFNIWIEKKKKDNFKIINSKVVLLPKNI